MRHRFARLAAALPFCALAPGMGPRAAVAQETIPPVRPLGPVVAVSKDPMSYIATIRPMSNGSVLALDTRAKRVVLFDSTLAHSAAVVDTTSGTQKAYGAMQGWLFPFTGDSSLFADYASLSFLVLDPAGKVGRVMAAPRGAGGALAYLSGTLVDAQGNVVSEQTEAGAERMAGAPPGPLVASARGAGPGGDPAPNVETAVRDSEVLVRVNLETRQLVRTVWVQDGTTYRAPGGTGPAGNPVMTTLRNPMRLNDLWTLMPDGTIAVIREHDYHIDWVAPDGSLTSSPKIQHQWVHLTDSAKSAILDSARAADSVRGLAGKRRVDSIVAAAKKSGLVVNTLSSGAVTIQNANGGITVYGLGGVGQYVDAVDLPDYLPPFDGPDTLGTVAKADADGNLWIRVRLPKRLEGGAVYDVVNRQGKLVDRVQVPGGTTLVGFIPGYAFLMSREGAGYVIARARIR